MNVATSISIRSIKALLLGALCVFASPAAIAAEPAETGPELPTLALELTPRYGDGAVQTLAVSITLQAPELDSGDVLFTMPTLIVSTPTAGLPASAFNVSDAQGAIALAHTDLEPTPTSNDREYRIDRATAGDVVIRYEVAPRDVDATTRNGPLFDLRREGNGLMGAGVYFLPVIAAQGPRRVVLDWDLSEAPEGARGIWSLGEGRQETVTAAQTLPFSYYAVGPVRSSSGSDDAFGFYWLSDLDFDVEEVAEETRRIFTGMAAFFGERDQPYRVFLRTNPYPAGGGTALARSFMFGVGSDGSSVQGGLTQLLAHEIAHNWPRLDHPAHAESSWYSEGAAEYYSLRLSRRMGLMDDDEYVEALNQRLEGYFTNAHVDVSNVRAGELYWTDSRAQRIPYGRGLVYLLQVDAQLKAAGHGGLDDVVLEILERQRAGDRVDLDGWVALLEPALGPAARIGFDQMSEGHRIELPVDALAPCFRVEEATVRGFELGYDRMNLGKVTGLVPGSAAEAAGLEEGDTVLAFTPLDELREDPERMMQIRVERDGRELAFEYLPRGEPVATPRFVRAAETPADGCGF